MRASSLPPARLAWPDVAKGACILLVVLHHVITKQYVDLVPRIDPRLGFLADGWHALTVALKPIRMPLFFTISGLFASSAVARPWRDSARRVLGGYYLYLVWLVLYLVLYTFETSMAANRTKGPGELVADLLWASTSMWFLYALVVYFVLVKLLRRLPAARVIGVAAVLTASVSFTGVDQTNRQSVLEHFVYFALGALFPSLVRSWALRPQRLLLAATAFAVLSAALALVGAPDSVSLLALSVIGVPFGVGVAVCLSRTPVAAPLAWVGRRTLRVYVLHLVVLAAWVHLPWQLPTGVGVGPALVALLVLYPLLVGALVVAACFGAYVVLTRLGLGLLFAPPAAPSWATGQPGTKVPSRLTSTPSG